MAQEESKRGNTNNASGSSNGKIINFITIKTCVISCTRHVEILFLQFKNIHHSHKQLNIPYKLYFPNEKNINN